MKDKIGQEIEPGDIVAYGHALGRCAGMRIGKILAIKENGHMTVRGVDDDWSFESPKLCARAGTLMYGSERVIVLERARVPEKYLQLLDGVPCL